ncbi:hypothetical protein MPRI_25770 [Mycobacterium paraintracellulare]|uniref:DUF2254 domain-containing protein n=1 Tax=Mycobacterium paraintracellulare TaxID=1138383 RepID=A0ABN6AR82_9MYCO|nr:hypothetical protein B8W68_04645 [Mycobacterium paraintracellulare]BBY70390.1 hypothetical protein MPRI_25770 [Mycobacterium paraintracellulare]
MIRLFWPAVAARFRLRLLAAPRWWRWRERWHRWDVQRSRWLQARSSQADGQRKNLAVAVELATKSAGIAIAAAVLLLANEALGTVLSHIGWGPAQHLAATRESTQYESLAQGLIGAEATLLALYYATVGVVASTAYVSVPGDIRKLFVQQRISTVYTRGIVRALVFTTVLFGLGSLGYHVRVLSVIVAVLLALLAVLRLAVVGIAPFGFFDPASLTRDLPQQFGRALSRATTLPTALDEGSQQHAHTDGRETLEHYRQITDLVASRPVRNSTAPLTVARQLLVLIAIYASQKNRIPSDSAWWTSIARYPNWFTLSADQTNLALAISTGVHTPTGPDLLWVERQCVADIAKLIVIVGRGQLDSFTSFLDRTAAHIRALSGRLLFDEALLLDDHIVAAIWEAVEPVADEPAPTAHLADERERDRVIAAQRSVVLLMNAWLGLVDAAEQLTNWRLSADVDRVIADRNALYEVGFPRSAVEMLEQLCERITFEKKVEGRQVTPTWFVHHHVARVLAQRLDAAQHAITQRFAKRTIGEVRSAIAARDWKLAAMVAFSALEMIDKIDTHQELIAGAHQALHRWKSAALDDPNWPTHPQPSPLDGGLRRQVLGYIADCLPNLPAGPHDRRQPDLYGQAYVFVFNATFDAILDGDHERAAAWFTTLFEQGQAAGRRMVADVAGQLPLLQFIYTVEPLVALMELSGYAILLQELDGEGIWEAIRPMWDSRRDQLGEGFLPNLLDIMANVDSAFSLNDLYVLRSTREQKLVRFLEERGITDPFDSLDFDKPHVRPATPLSPIVAAFAPGSFGITWKPTDLFLVHYVLPQLGDDTKVPPNLSALIQTLAQFEEDRAAAAERAARPDTTVPSADDADSD